MAMQAVFESRLKDMAMAVPLMCCAADMISVPSHKQVVLVGHKSSLEFDKMLAAAHASYDPNRTVSRRASISIHEPHVLCLWFLLLSLSEMQLLPFAGDSYRSYRQWRNGDLGGQ